MPIDEIINQTTDIRKQREVTNGAATHPEGGQQRLVADGGQQQAQQVQIPMGMPQSPMGWLMALQAANVLLLAVLVFVK